MLSSGKGHPTWQGGDSGERGSWVASQEGSSRKSLLWKPTTYLKAKHCDYLMFMSLSFCLQKVLPYCQHVNEVGGRGGGCEASVFQHFPSSSLCSLCSLINRKARAVYPCEAEHSSELSFEIGAIFEDGKYCQELCGGSHHVFP